VIQYDRTEADDPGPGFGVAAQCWCRPEYERVTIRIDPGEIDDEKHLEDVLTHELLHVVASPYQAYRNIVTSNIKAKSSADAAEERAWTDACERTVRNLERLVFSLRKVARGETVMAKEAKAKTKVEKTPKPTTAKPPAQSKATEAKPPKGKKAK
jgi:hypothetical protein